MSARRILSVVVLLTGLSPFVLAQGGATGAINGTVQDASGAVLAGARVDVVSEGTGQVVRQLLPIPRECLSFRSYRWELIQLR
jgi:hypothetical protein